MKAKQQLLPFHEFLKKIAKMDAIDLGVFVSGRQLAIFLARNMTIPEKEVPAVRDMFKQILKGLDPINILTVGAIREVIAILDLQVKPKKIPRRRRL